jgi:D-glycero-alpha-D-manno-heptose 1-phosphate guanylyltransferase
MFSKVDAMEAIILAGGFGTRLQSVLKDVPKPMAPIQNRPFLSYVLDYLLRWRIGRILLSVGYKHEVIRSYFGPAYNGMEIDYVVESKPLGTGGAIRQALKRAQGSDVMVLNGDSFLNADLDSMAGFHAGHASLLTLAVKPMRNVDRYGTVIVKDGRIVHFEEKTAKDFGYINGGVYIVKRSIADHLERYNDPFSFESDFLARRTRELQPAAFICDEYFIDIGIPDDYKKAEQELGSVLGRRADHDRFKNTP